MRRRACRIAAVMIALVGLAGCTSVAEPDVRPSATEVQPSPLPSPTSSPTPDPDDPSTWLLTNEGVGPYRLGMPIADALAVVPGFEDACGYAFRRSFGDAMTEDVWIAQFEGTLSYVQSSAVDGPRTPEGVGVGSTTAEVLSAFPDAVVVSRNLDYLRAGNVFFGFRSDITYEFDEAPYQDDDGVPEEILAVGVTSGDILWEFCG